LRWRSPPGDLPCGRCRATAKLLDQKGTEVQAICEDLVRRGPALGIVPAFATQRPDAKSLPTAISANAVLRFCLKVMGQTENDMVLGTSAYKNGVLATMFARTDRGIGYLAGEGDDPQIVRCFYVDAPTAERIVARARALRDRAGTLSGHALGEDPDPVDPAASLLADVLAVVPAGEGRVWNETVIARLVELRPEVRPPTASAAAPSARRPTTAPRRLVASARPARPSSPASTYPLTSTAA
jgi:S-DNA-T family DNA segregation ATPase FtsK/SpoIIIE